MSKRKQPQQQYYNIRSLLSKNAIYNIIIGERSNGKTYAVLKYAVEQYFKDKSQFAILRRWQEDITGHRAGQMFTNLIANGEIERISHGMYTGITYYARKFYFCNYDEKGKPVYDAEHDIFAYCFALSEMEHDKSISFPYVNTILFDEFITNKLYLQDEFVLFMNTISTIIRQRENVKIFMCGNTVNKFCPYFQEMGLKHVDKMQQGTIDVYTYGDSRLSVAFEYCAQTGQTKANNYYFAFDNPKLHMITSGAWELDIYPHCPVRYRPKDVKFTYFILFNGYIYQCEIVSIDKSMFTFIHLKTTDLQKPDKDLIFSLDYVPKINYNRNVLKPGIKRLEKLSWFFQTGRVYYQNNEVGDSISNYLKICMGGI